MQQQGFAVRLLVVSLASFALTACSGGGEEPSEADSGPQVKEDVSVDVPDGETAPMDENCDPADYPRQLPDLALEPIAGDHTYNSALHLTQSPGDDETLYVVERPGRILVVRDGKLRSEPFLDIRDKVITGFPSRGLLGLAFHPNYEQNGRFFVDYTSNGTKRNVVAEYKRADGKQFEADPNEVRRLVKIKDPKKQHNGGTVLFGPDGYLYASLGNGGAKEKSKHDGIGQAQYLGNVFGTIMRMDVDAPDKNFAAPDNPFVDEQDADGRIFVYGLRNPWRFSFDAKTGDMYIGDAGKRSREEIDFVPAESTGGENFGWPAWEGTKEGPVQTAKRVIDEHVEPIYEYKHKSDQAYLKGGVATIGGQVYRGEKFPSLKGYFVYGDLGSNNLAAMRFCDTPDADRKNEIVDHQQLTGKILPDSVRGVVPDNGGELYVVTKKKVRRIVGK